MTYGNRDGPCGGRAGWGGPWGPRGHWHGPWGGHGHASFTSFDEMPAGVFVMPMMGPGFYAGPPPFGPPCGGGRFGPPEGHPWRQHWEQMRNARRAGKFGMGRRGQEHGEVAMDVIETEDYFEIIVDVPGKTEANILVYVDDGQLAIEGGATPTHNDDGGKHSKAKVLKRGRREDGFRKTFKLTKKSNPDAIYHSVENGVLTVVVPKAVPNQDATAAKSPMDVDESGKPEQKQSESLYPPPPAPMDISQLAKDQATPSRQRESAEPGNFQNQDDGDGFEHVHNIPEL